jgi:hypothetical protein
MWVVLITVLGVQCFFVSSIAGVSSVNVNVTCACGACGHIEERGQIRDLYYQIVETF